LFIALPVASQSSKSLELNSVIYPERQTTDIGFLTTKAAPVATLTAEVAASKGQTLVEISFSGMKPAILFGGNVTSYVVWAVTRDGETENLGELWVRDSKGKLRFQSAHRDFAMMITAESFPLSLRPSPLVAFISGPAGAGRATNNTFVFSDFGEPVIPTTDSIATLTYKGKDPIDLVQAERIFEMADSSGASDYDPKAMDQARITLAQARNLAKAGDKTVSDYARRTVALASQALREMEKQMAAAAAAAEEARRKAELEAAQDEAERIAQQLEAVRLQREALDGEMRRATARANATAAALAEVEKQRAIMTEERDRLEAERDMIAKERDEVATERDAITTERDALATERDALARERDALAAQRDEIAKERDEIAKDRDEIARQKEALEKRLSGALEKVAATSNTARGLVVNLSGILFDLGKATLQTEAQLTVSKLSGVLLMMPDVNLRVEGHTDSTGSDELNEKLSRERARTVYDLLLRQGIPEERMSYAGYGPRFPVASNDSKDGRALNRRVEVILKEGKVKAADEERPE
jgi:outer membrane protein OmpA-like peptidoglycan-associated protein